MMSAPLPQRRRVIPVLALLALAIGMGACFWTASLPSCPVVLRFLDYTNNGHARIALSEITNQSKGDFTWSLHAGGRSRDHRVAVTELMETNGEWRHIGSGGPLNLFRQDSMRFGTDELSLGEKKVWVSIRSYPAMSGDRQRERLSGWLYRLGFHRGAFEVKPGTRMDEVVMP